MKRMDESHPEWEFRNMAVERALSSKNRAAVARELNIPYQRLRDWIDSYKKRQEKLETLQINTELKAELNQSKKQIAELQEEVEILKKAAAYFAKNQ